MRKNKMRKKKIMQETGWATTHFQFSLGHDAGNFIVTQSWGGRHGRATGGATQPGWCAVGRCDK